MVRKFLPKYDFEIYNWGKRLIFKKRNSFRDRSCQLWRTIHTGQANILYKLRKYNATAQTQCDYANTKTICT